jgi:hypothetical protein
VAEPGEGDVAGLAGQQPQVVGAVVGGQDPLAGPPVPQGQHNHGRDRVTVVAQAAGKATVNNGAADEARMLS